MTNVKIRITCWTICLVRDGKSSQQDLHCFTEATSNYPKWRASSWQRQEAELTARFSSALSVDKSCKKRSMCLFIVSAELIKKAIQHESERHKQPPQKVLLISHETAKTHTLFMWQLTDNLPVLQSDLLIASSTIVFCSFCCPYLHHFWVPPSLFERQDSEISSVIALALWHNLSLDKAGWAFFFLLICRRS